jgi:hypothetical protein
LKRDENLGSFRRVKRSLGLPREHHQAYQGEAQTIAVTLVYFY